MTSRDKMKEFWFYLGYNDSRTVPPEDTRDEQENSGNQLEIFESFALQWTVLTDSSWYLLSLNSLWTPDEGKAGTVRVEWNKTAT